MLRIPGVKEQGRALGNFATFMVLRVPDVISQLIKATKDTFLVLREPEIKFKCVYLII